MRPLKVEIESQGAIWSTVVVVLANQPNLVVLSIDTEQKYVQCSSDVYDRGKGRIQLYPDERTLRLRKGDRSSTFIKVSGLAKSPNWRTMAEGGRYCCHVTFYRLDPKRRQRQIAMEPR